MVCFVELSTFPLLDSTIWSPAIKVYHPSTTTEEGITGQRTQQARRDRQYDGLGKQFEESKTATYSLSSTSRVLLLG